MKIVGCGLRVFAAMIVLGAGYLLVEAWKEGSAGPTAPNIHGLPVQSASARLSAPDCSPPATTPVLDVVIHSYESQSGTVLLDDEVCLPEAIVAKLVNSKGQKITRRGARGLELKPAYDQARLGLELVGDSRSDETPPIEEITLASILAAHGTFIRTESVPLSVTGSFSKYPFDSYAATLVLQMHLQGGGIGLAARPLGRISSSFLPFELKSYVGADIAPLGVETTTGPATSAPGLALDSHGRLLGIEMERSTHAQLYVLLVAIVPFILELLLFVVTLRGPAGMSPEALVGFGAVLLAIVPIRAVLVPATASELTLVDYWLGVEVAILAALACVAVSRTVMAAQH
jgi:hypothetical protein